MKKIFALVLVFFGLTIFSQNPPLVINYQGVARTLTGTPIVGPIGIKLEIHKGGGAGPVVFTEIQSRVTNQFGIFNLQIGSGNTSAFAAIDWSQGPYFLEVSIDPLGGTSHVSTGIQQLVSVPYALYGDKVKNAPSATLIAGTNVTVTNGSTPNTFTIDARSGSGGGPWTAVGSNVFLLNNANSVGIGNNAPTAKLDVNTGASNAQDGIYAVTGTGNGIVGSAATTSTLFSGVKGINTATGAGVFGLNSSGGTGVYGENMMGNASVNANGVNGRTNSQNNIASGVLGENYGQGPGMYGFQGNPSAGVNGHGVYGVSNSSSASGIFGTNSSVAGGTAVYGVIGSAPASSNAHGVKGETNGLSVQAAGVIGDNKGSGAGVVGTNVLTSGSTGANGVVGKTNGTSGAASGVYGENLGNGDGVYGLTTASNTTAHGVYGKNIGSGFGVFGETASSFSIVAGVNGLNTGLGPALKGSLPTGTLAGGTNLSLLLDNGHMRSMQLNAPAVTTFTAVGGATSATYTLINCTDVKGTLMAVCTTTGMINVSGFFTIKVAFSKTYVVPPTVVVTPTSDFGTMSYYVSSVTPGFFHVTIKNNTATNVLGGSQPYNFNYFVIE